MRPRTAPGAELVGPYEIVRAIGAGGSARVDLARLQRAYGFQRHVVIKRPLEHLRADARVAASLRREAGLGTRLRHPNLVTILDAGEHDGYDYLVLEYIHGGSLRSLVEAEEPTRIREVPLGVALAIVGDVARGLHQAHELTDERGGPLGLVHRDVSPGNVLIGADGTVKLADFGIAKETRVQTLSGSMQGTVTYMAPEQCRGHAFDRRADVFSLGVILYELVTGARLFYADNDVASLHRVLSGQIVRPRKVRASVPLAIEELVMSAIAQDPERRLATAGALADAIDQHAAALGELIAPRVIARWVHDVIGPREAPWVGEETVVDAIPAPPPEPLAPSSLVELIAATPDDEPHVTAFGPTDDAERDRQPRRAPGMPPRRRGWIAVVLAIGAIAAGGAVWVAARGDDSGAVVAPGELAPEPAPVAGSAAEPGSGSAAGSAAEPAAGSVAEPGSASAAGSVAEPGSASAAGSAAEPGSASVAGSAAEPGAGSAGSVAAPSTGQAAVVPPGGDVVEVAPTGDRVAQPKRTRRPAKPPVRAAGRGSGSGSGSASAGGGSGSAAPVVKPPRVPVEWTPDILLPTDKAPAGSGTNKR